MPKGKITFNVQGLTCKPSRAIECAKEDVKKLKYLKKASIKIFEKIIRIIIPLVLPTATLESHWAIKKLRTITTAKRDRKMGINER